MRVLGFVLALCLFSCNGAYGQRPGCTAKQGLRAEYETDNLKGWDSLYIWYVRYHNCDEGAIAEGYAEAVARLMVDHWSTLPKFPTLYKSSPKFRTFVLKHIDATLAMNDLERIRKNAIGGCPANMAKDCRDIRNAVDRAINNP